MKEGQDEREVKNGPHLLDVNPMMDGLFSGGEYYPYSSASCHISGKNNPAIMTDCLNSYAVRYKQFFYQEEHPQDMEAIRRATQQGKACGALHS